MPKLLKFIIILLLVFTVFWSPIQPTSTCYAVGESPIDILKGINPSTGEILPSFAGEGGSSPHRMATAASLSGGLSSIGSVILFVTDFFKFIMASIAVLFLFIAGIRLITGGKKEEEVITKEKDNIKWIIMGLIIIILAQPAIHEVFFGEEGEFLTDQSIAESYAEKGSEYIRGIYSFMEIFLGAIAVLVIILSGMRIIASGGADDTITAERKHIIWAMIGLIIVGLSEAIVKNIIFVDGGTQTDLTAGWGIIIMLTNFLAGMIAIFAISMLLYGGYLYVVSTGNEQMTEKGRKVMISAILAIVVTTVAYALVNTFMKVSS